MPNHRAYAAILCSLLIAHTPPASAEEACEGGRLIPAQYEEREVEVIRDAYTRSIETLTSYIIVEEDIVVEESRCPGEVPKYLIKTVIINETEDSLGLDPPVFEMVTDVKGQRRQVLKKNTTVKRIPSDPATVKIRVPNPDAVNVFCAPEDMIPAVSRTIKRHVVDTPSSARWEKIPETVVTITEKVLIAPERCEQKE